MTKEQAIEKLKALTRTDPESAHVDADAILCDLLNGLGYGDVVEEFLNVPKWPSPKRQVTMGQTYPFVKIQAGKDLEKTDNPLPARFVGRVFCFDHSLVIAGRGRRIKIMPFPNTASVNHSINMNGGFFAQS